MSIHIDLIRWGRDHWSTFAYIAHWCQEYGANGFPVASDRHRRQMRVDPKIHPGLAWAMPIDGEVADGGEYPTRLNDGVEVRGHDDYSCVEDMGREGLVEWKGTGISPIFRLTERGLEAHLIVAAHKTEGGNFGDRWLSLRVWQGLLKPGDKVRAGGAEALVLEVNDAGVRARFSGGENCGFPFDWEQVEPLEAAL